MNKKLIALAQAEGCAIINDATVEELGKVLDAALGSRTIWSGIYKYYWADKTQSFGWDMSNTAPSLPCHSVREFLQDEEEQWEPKWGEEVMYRGNKMTFVAVSPFDKEYWVLVDEERDYVSYPVSSLTRITPKRRITRAEIKEKLGIEGEWEIVD